jgi:hypothetical protein
VIEMISDETWEKVKSEALKLGKEYATLKNKPRLFETETEKDARLIQLEKDEREKLGQYRSSGDDFEKRRDYVLRLKKEVETMRMRERKDELEQKLKDQTIAEKELLELQALNNIQKTN